MSDVKDEQGERFPRRTMRRQNTRARILASAMSLFRRLGYGAATMNAIADAADIHVTTLFTHFKSKQELAATLNDAGIERLEALIAASQGKVPFFVFFRGVVLDMARSLEAEVEPSLSLWHELRRDPELSLAWADYEQRQVALLAAYIAADFGLKSSDYAAQLAASTLLASSWASHRRWSENAGKRDLEKETLAALDLAEVMAKAALKKAGATVRR